MSGPEGMHKDYFRPRLLSLAAMLAIYACAPSGVGESAEICKNPRTSSETIKAYDGAPLFLQISGIGCDKQAILWLHGGPGGAERPLFRLYNGTLETSYTSAYWDQRGAGRSFVADADPGKLTTATHLRDLDEIVDVLRRQLRVDRIVLVGHSWGAALGMLYARSHPDKIWGVVAVAPLISGLASAQARYVFAQTEAQARHDVGAIEALASWGSPPFSVEEDHRLDDLVARYGGAFHIQPNKLGAVVEGVLKGYVSPFEIIDIIRGNNVSLAAMHDEILRLDLRAAVPSLDVPVVFMLGRYDWQTGSQVSKNYFQDLSAPQKQLIWFENSAHNIPFEETDAFNRALDESIQLMLKGSRH
jgi:proline iminopeptidase